MKVLFTGYHNPNYPTVTEYIEQALKELGHEIVVLDEGRHLLPGRLRVRSRLLEAMDLLAGWGPFGDRPASVVPWEGFGETWVRGRLEGEETAVASVMISPAAARCA